LLSRKWNIPSSKILNESNSLAGRNFLSQEETSCQWKKITATGRKVPIQEVSSCHTKIFAIPGIMLISQEEIPVNKGIFDYL
jgi:hypothetical protein